VVTLAGLQFGHLLGGAVITEIVFAIPGVGRLVVEGIIARDFPLVQGSVLFLSAGFVFVNLLVDILYAYLDPRIHYT
jgi:peptide/nickel transport system permease protein